MLSSTGVSLTMRLVAELENQTGFHTGTGRIVHGGEPGATTVHQSFKQRVRREPVGSHHAGAGAFAGRIQAGDARAPSRSVRMPPM